MLYLRILLVCSIEIINNCQIQRWSSGWTMEPDHLGLSTCSLCGLPQGIYLFVPPFPRLSSEDHDRNYNNELFKDWRINVWNAFRDLPAQHIVSLTETGKY